MVVILPQHEERERGKPDVHRTHCVCEGRFVPNKSNHEIANKTDSKNRERHESHATVKPGSPIELHDKCTDHCCHREQCRKEQITLGEKSMPFARACGAPSGKQNHERKT